MFNPFKPIRTGLLLRRLVKSNEDIATSLRAIVRHLDRNDTHIGAALDTDYTDVEILHTTDSGTWEQEQRDRGREKRWEETS
jgi:hypothetical protein